MNDKQFQEGMRVLGFRGHTISGVKGILDGLERGYSAGSIGNGGFYNNNFLHYSVDPKTVRQFKTKFYEIQNLINEYDGNAAAETHEESFNISAAQLSKQFNSNKQKAGIQSVINDPYSIKRLEIMRDLEEQVPEEKWNLGYLLSIGFSEELALAMLSEHDQIELWRLNAEKESSSYTPNPEYQKAKDLGIKTPSVVSGWWVEEPTKLALFIQFNRYVQLYYDVIFQSINYLNTKIPGAYKSAAHKLIIRGLYDEDQLLVRTGKAIIRYQIWKKPEYKSAFEISLRNWKPTKKQADRFIKSIYKEIEKEIALEGKRNG